MHPIIALAVAAALAAAWPQPGTGFTPQHRLGSHAGDDWEPALASDAAGRLYAVYYHVNVSRVDRCMGCDRHLLVQISEDGGATWSAPHPIAPIPVRDGQFDPWIAIDPADGRTVDITFMQNDPAVIMFVRSRDGGATWSRPTAVSEPNARGYDKDVLVARGGTLAVAYDDFLDTWVAVSHDGGAHWSQHRVERQPRFYQQMLASGGAIDSLGDLYFAWNRFDNAARRAPSRLWLTKSADGGHTWHHVDVDVGGSPPRCTPCGAGAFLAPQIAMRIGPDDALYVLWNTTPDLTNGAPERIYFARSTDRAASFSPRRDVSDAPAGTEHAFPTLAAGATPGDVRLAWMDERTFAWNVFYRSSRDGGRSFSATSRISSFEPGYRYLSARGFRFPYGDFFQMTISPDGLTHVAFGETSAYVDPGNVWVSSQTPQQKP